MEASGRERLHGKSRKESKVNRGAAMKNLLLGMKPGGEDLKVDLGMRRIKLPVCSAESCRLDSKRGRVLGGGLELPGAVPGLGWAAGAAGAALMQAGAVEEENTCIALVSVLGHVRKGPSYD